MMYAENLVPRLQEIARRAAEPVGVEIAWVEFKRQKSSWVLRVFIDSESGVGLKECERVSERLSVLLDVEDPIESSYTLEVSTPGLDRPLLGRPDYERFQGRLARVKTREAMDGRKKFMGRLAGVEDERVIIEDEREKKRWEIPFSNIDRGRLEPEISPPARNPSPAKARKHS